MPYLRRVTLQREADERKIAEAKRQAKLKREMLEKQNRALLKSEVADMGITFDDQGQPIKVKKLDPQYFSNNLESKKIIEPNLREDLTEVISSDFAQKVKELRDAKRQQSMEEFELHSPSHSEHDTEVKELNLDAAIETPTNATGTTPSGKQLIAK